MASTPLKRGDYICQRGGRWWRCAENQGIGSGVNSVAICTEDTSLDDRIGRGYHSLKFIVVRMMTKKGVWEISEEKLAEVFPKPKPTKHEIAEQEARKRRGAKGLPAEVAAKKQREIQKSVSGASATEIKTDSVSSAKPITPESK